MANETYLGDGVYASHDGWQIKLRTTFGDHTVYLDPDAYSALVKFVEAVKKGEIEINE